jgi:DNA-binding transcriptional ArsR family regulator
VTTKLPSETYDLLAHRINSFEKLEIVVALHRAPHSTMSVDELCRALGLAREVVSQTVIDLRRAALVELTLRGDLRLLPPTNQEYTAVAELARLYHEDRMTLAKALGEIALDRLRSMTSRAFADAFVLRKKLKKRGDDDG